MVLPVREHHERLIVFEYKQDRFPRVDGYLAPSVVRVEKARGSPLLFPLRRREDREGTE